MNKPTSIDISSIPPAPVFSYFAQIARIPRLSGAELGVARFLCDLCKEQRWNFQQDALGNVVINVPARGRGHRSPAVILQGHMDMVGAKTASSQHNFETDPIIIQCSKRVVEDAAQVPREEEVLHAYDTTLGADNGIGIALALAAASDNELLDCPALELVFTVSEEVGLEGAHALDCTQLQARSLINLDCFDLGEICIGCAAACDVSLQLALEREPAPPGHCALRVSFSGLPGGHSGDEIHLDRPSATVVLRSAIRSLLQSGVSLRLSSLAGGERRNAIAQSASFMAYIPQAEVAQFKQFFSAANEEFAALSARFPQFRMQIEELSEPVLQPLTTTSQQKAVELLLAIPHGVLEVSSTMPGLTQTSNNLALLATTLDELRITLLPRSSRPGALETMLSNWRHLWSQLGAKVIGDASAGAIWEPRPTDPLVEEVARAYRRAGVEPRVSATHGGVECGIIVSKLPGMSAVSIGPNIRRAHSPEECLVISSVAPVWYCLREFLLARALAAGESA